MNHRTESYLLAMTWSLLIGFAIQAQTIKLPDRPSHLPLPTMPGLPEVSPDGIQGQLDQLALEELLKRALKNPERFGLKDDPDAKALIPKDGQAPKLDPNDPRVKSLMEKLYKPYEGKNPRDLPKGITADQLEQLKKRIEQFQPPKAANGGSTGSGPGIGGEGPSNSGGDQGGPKQMPPNIGSQQPPVLPPRVPPEPPAPSTPKPTEAEQKESETKKALAKAVETFKESGSLTKAIQSLSEGDENGSGMLNGWEDKSESDFDWSRFGKQTGIDRLEKWLPKLDWNWSDAASKMPSISAPSWNTNAPSVLPSGPAGFEAGSSILTVFLVVVVLVVLAIAVWKFRDWFASEDAQDGNGPWHLGPWPVQPALVRTREELVRAFEYLSLLRLGRTARNWNHRHIAMELGQAKDVPPEGSTAAARLATVYEHARYAPAADTLGDRDFEAARHDLCLLAGVPSA